MLTPFGSTLGKSNVRHLLHLTSCILFYAPTGLSWFVGNLLVYLNSFMYANEGNTDFETPWLISIFHISWSISMILGGYFVRRVDAIISQSLGVLLFELGFLLSWRTVHHVYPDLLLTLGVISGLGKGLLLTEIFDRLNKLMKEKAGTYMVVVATAEGFGGILFNAIITWYVNPKNLKADYGFRHVQLFTDKSIIERVPSLFIVLGSICVTLHLMGLCLTLSLRYIENENMTDKFRDSNSDSIKEDSHSNSQSKNLSNGSDENSQKFYRDKRQQMDFNENAEEKTKLLPLPDKKERNFHSICKGYNTSQEDTQCIHSLGDCSEGKSTHPLDLSTWQMLKTRQFYVIWLSKFTCGVVGVVILNSYKEFGQLWIHDDHFLTTLGIVATAAICVSRLVLSFLVEKIKVKDMHIILTFVASLTCLFFYFIPRINRWLYLVWTCLTLSVNSVIGTYIQIMVLKSFGKTYFGEKYGVILTSSCVIYTVAPLTFRAVLQTSGWSAIFIGTGAIYVFLLIVSLLF